MQCDCDAGWSGEACDCGCSGQGVNGGNCPSAGSSDVQLCQINGGACSPSLYGTLKDDDGEVITSLALILTLAPAPTLTPTLNLAPTLTLTLPTNH